MSNAIIIGTGKIGIDLYIKLKKKKVFENILIFNNNQNSEGAKYCQKKNFSYFNTGIKGVEKNLDKCKVIFDCTSASSNSAIIKKLKKKIKDIYYLNLTPSKFGDFVVPYFINTDIPKKINLITCGGQTSIPIISYFRKKFKKKLKYVELVSSISAKSAGPATRKNIDEYITNTERAINKLTEIKRNKVIININPSDPPVNMMNTVFFEFSKPVENREYQELKKILKSINQRIKFYIPGYNAILFKSFDRNILRVTVRVVGQGDYLPSYAGNLDIITSSAVYLGKLIERN
tara:strand:- start:49 stop:918 length:870 start_codon:yes stop_codon:yes gene_type:complete